MPERSDDNSEYHNETQPVLGASPHTPRVSDLITIALGQTIMKLKTPQNSLREACQSESHTFSPAANFLGHTIPTMQSHRTCSIHTRTQTTPLRHASYRMSSRVE